MTTSARFRLALEFCDPAWEAEDPKWVLHIIKPLRELTGLGLNDSKALVLAACVKPQMVWPCPHTTTEEALQWFDIIEKHFQDSVRNCCCGPWGTTIHLGTWGLIDYELERMIKRAKFSVVSVPPNRSSSE